MIAEKKTKAKIDEKSIYTIDTDNIDLIVLKCFYFNNNKLCKLN